MKGQIDGFAGAHVTVGVAMLVLFLLTGQYMREVLDVAGMPDFPRLMHRSAHIYLFFTAVTNIALGLYAAPGSLRGWWCGACSALVLLAPFLMAYSFLVESPLPALERPMAFYGALATFIGISGHLARAARRRAAHRSGQC